jgi:hypothetical protein
VPGCRATASRPAVPSVERHMTRIVTTHYRYKRPRRKKKPVAIEVPAIVTGKGSRRPADSQMAAEVISRTPQPSTTQDERRDRAVTPGGKPKPANDYRKSAIVTIRRPGKRFADVPDMTPEEHKRRGDGADAMFREMKRQIAKERP